jgi:chromosome segregation ATPase
MQFAVDRVKELRALLKLEQHEVDKLHREIQSYKKPLTEHQKASTADDNEQIPAYTEEISRLKDKIKEITSQQHHQTDEILELGRRHKQMATSNLGRTKSTPKRQILDDTLTNSIAEARRKYEDIGRKLEILRVRRNILLQEDGHLEDRKKLLQSYQSKY